MDQLGSTRMEAENGSAWKNQLGSTRMQTEACGPSLYFCSNNQSARHATIKTARSPIPARTKEHNCVVPVIFHHARVRLHRRETLTKKISTHLEQDTFVSWSYQWRHSSQRLLALARPSRTNIYIYIYICTYICVYIYMDYIYMYIWYMSLPRRGNA